MAAMAALIVGGALIGGVATGISDAKSGNMLRQGICSTNQAIDTVTAAYNRLLSQEEDDISNLQTELSNSIDKLNNEKETLKMLRENYAKSRNQMVIASIIFITSIIISFIFKKAGFFDLLYESIYGKQK